MTVLTKVLVLLLTVFSIALSMLTVSAFSQQQNWKASAEDWQQAATAAQAKERTVAANAAIEKARALDQARTDARQINKMKADVVAAEGRIAELERSMTESQQRLAVEQGQVSSTTESIQLIQADLNREREFSARMAKRNSELERGNIDLTDRVKELTTNIEMAKAQVRALQQQIAGMDGTAGAGSAGLHTAMQVPGGPGIVESGVPSVIPEGVASTAFPIRGEVTSITDNLASISVGSADGVAHGMNFLIYRRAGDGGRPQYLGTLKITKVEANQAAGQIEQSEGDIHTGDLVRDEASFAMRS